MLRDKIEEKINLEKITKVKKNNKKTSECVGRSPVKGDQFSSKGVGHPR
jgi:hypothetical protein